jgi:hypothetical protein
VQAHIEQLVCGNLRFRLDGIDLGQRLGFVHHAAAELQEQAEADEPD